MATKRTQILELAVLGLLHEAPMHGYELRKQLKVQLGAFRALGFGTLYPCLRELVARGWIAEDDSAATATAASRRSKISYKLTAEGKEHFQELMTSSDSTAWEDDNFGVHFAFFGRTNANVRIRILEGRRSRLEERMEAVRASLNRTKERLDSYTLELQRHGLESTEREVRWLNELIRTEHEQAFPVQQQQGSPEPRTS
jgi:DNA-binding PadR family transcriptional regulator